MSLFLSVMDELEGALKSGTPGKRTEVLRQVTALFVDRAESIPEQQLSLFDDIVTHLVSRIEKEAVAELSERLASVNARSRVIRRLASNDDIKIAGPILQNSPSLTDDELVEFVKTKSQAHQLKIAARSQLNETVTEVLIDQCDREVANKVAINKGARFSQRGFSKLVMMADGDDRLTEALAKRPDLSPRLFRQLLAHATESVRTTLLTSAPIEVRDSLNKILNDVSGQIGTRATQRYFAEAERAVSVFSQDTALMKQKLLEFANEGKLEETVVALSILSAIPIELVDRLIHDTSPYGILVLCKVTALHWHVARAVMTIRPRLQGEYDLDELRSDYVNISASAAQRLFRFWQSRQTISAPMPATVVQAVA